MSFNVFNVHRIKPDILAIIRQPILFQPYRGADECEQQMVAGVAFNLGARF